MVALGEAAEIFVALNKNVERREEQDSCCRFRSLMPAASTLCAIGYSRHIEANHPNHPTTTTTTRGRLSLRPVVVCFGPDRRWAARAQHCKVG